MANKINFGRLADVYRFVIEYKAANGGNSPSAVEIAEAADVSVQVASGRALITQGYQHGDE